MAQAPHPLPSPPIEYLLIGRAGGQTVIGGTGIQDNLYLQSTTHADKGDVLVNDGSGFGVGVASVAAGTAVRIDGSKTVLSSASAQWDGLHVGGTVSLTGGTNVTSSVLANARFAAPVVSGGVTVTDVANVLITGSPTTGGGATITNSYSLYVQGGGSRFDGPVGMGAKAVSGVPLYISYNNTSPSAPGIILTSSAAAGTGHSVIELREDSGVTTTGKWRADGVGDVWHESARHMTFKANVAGGGVELLKLQKSGSFGLGTFYYGAANTSTTTPVLLLDGATSDQVVIGFKTVYATDTYFRADSNGQMNADPATNFNVNPGANSVRRLRVTTDGVFGSHLASADLILGSTTDATKGNVRTADRVLVGPAADITGGTYTSGIQLQGASGGHAIFGRTVAQTGGNIMTLAGYNGATEVAAVTFDGGGATDSGQMSVYTRATGGSPYAKRLTVSSVGNTLMGTATESAWSGAGPVIEGYGTSVVFGGFGGGTAADISVNSNAYYNGANWIRKLANYAANHLINDGDHTFQTAGTSTAGSTITWSTGMKIHRAGDISFNYATAGEPESYFGSNSRVLSMMGTTADRPAIMLLQNSATVITNGNVGAVEFGATAQDAAHKVLAAIAVQSTQNTTTSGSRMDFHVKANGGTRAPAMRIEQNGRVLFGQITDLTGGTYTVGVQVADATNGNLVMGRTSAHTSTTLANIAFYNGATNAAHISANGGGATDSADLFFYTRPTGGALTVRTTILSNGRTLFGQATDVTGGTYTTGIQVAQTSTAGHLVLGRNTASTSAAIGETAYYNGASTLAAMIQTAGDGATDSAKMSLYTKATGVGLSSKLDINGVGLFTLHGATAQAWHSTIGPVMQGNSSAFAWGTGTDIHMASNAVFVSPGWQRHTAAASANYYMYLGEHYWRTAGSAGAGTAITWTEPLKIQVGGHIVAPAGAAATATTIGLGLGGISMWGINSSSAGNYAGGMINGSTNATLLAYTGYNATTRVGIMEIIGGGATDAGQFDWWTKPTGSAIALRMSLTAGGRLNLGNGGSDITGGGVTTGLQVSGLTTNQGNLVTGRATAATTGICSAIFGYNGANYIGHHGWYADGANNSGYTSIFTASGGAVAEQMRINSLGRMLVGNAGADITGGVITTGLQVSGLTTNQGNFVLGRATAATTGDTAAICGNNGANMVTIIKTIADGATDAGAMTILTKATGVGIAERFRVTSKGNITLAAATESSWVAASTGTAIEGTSTSIAFGATATGGDLYANSNAYFNASWKRKTANLAAQVSMFQGEILFRTAATGAADSAITWLQSTIDSVGRFVVGATTADSTTTTGLQIHNSAGSANLLFKRTTGSLGDIGFMSFMSGSDQVAAVQVAGDGATDAGKIQIFTKPTGSGIAEAMRITSVGNVGFGTAGTANIAGSGRAITLSTGTAGDSGSARLELQASRTTDGSFGVLDFYHQGNRGARIGAERAGADNTVDLAFSTMVAGVFAGRAKITSGGDFHVGTAALATGATAGFMMTAAMAGAPSGAPTIPTGLVAWVYDSTNHKIYVSSGGTWRSTAALT